MYLKWGDSVENQSEVARWENSVRRESKPIPAPSLTYQILTFSLYYLFSNLNFTFLSSAHSQAKLSAISWQETFHEADPPEAEKFSTY